MKKPHHTITLVEPAPVAEPSARDQMIARGGRWAVYQNADLTTGLLAGHRKFLKFGDPTCTFPTVESLPDHYPDPTITHGVNYLLCGEIDPKTGVLTRLDG